MRQTSPAAIHKPLNVCRLIYVPDFIGLPGNRLPGTAPTVAFEVGNCGSNAALAMNERIAMEAPFTHPHCVFRMKAACARDVLSPNAIGVVMIYGAMQVHDPFWRKEFLEGREIVHPTAAE